MSELDKAPPSMLKFVGTPTEVGGQIWERMCNPAVRASTARPERERIQLYAGILMAAFGSIAADFGHANASGMLHTLVDAFDDMAGELGNITTQ
jgi:hypothetical protein